jgi:hypothetical protein
MRSFSVFATIATAASLLASSAPAQDNKVCAEVRTDCVAGACAEKCVPGRETPPDGTVGSGVRNPTRNKPAEPNGPYSPPDLGARTPGAPSTPGGTQMPNSANPNGR